MADQVIPSGGLAAGTAQILQAITVPSSSKSSSNQPAAPKPTVALERRESDASTKELEAATRSVEDYLQQAPSFSNLQFRVDKETGISYLKIVDPETKRTIRQFPPEEVLAMARKLKELNTPKDASGVLMDEKV